MKRLLSSLLALLTLALPATGLAEAPAPQEQVTVWGLPVDSYLRPESQRIDMPAGGAYLSLDFGVTAFRGGAFRMNAASGALETAPTGLELAWTAEGGTLVTNHGAQGGFGVEAQPIIIKWARELRQEMPLDEGFREQSAMKEVILTGQDGRGYFLELESGKATRRLIDLGFPLNGCVTLHPLQYPMLLAARRDGPGLYSYNLANNQLAHVDDSLSGAALIDRSTHTLVAPGAAGALCTVPLEPRIYLTGEGLICQIANRGASVALIPSQEGREPCHTKVRSSPAMSGSLAFYADLGGLLRCVDTTTMTTRWTADLGDAVRAAVALDLDAEDKLHLYTANTLTNRPGAGDVTIRRLNALTGETEWAVAIPCKALDGWADATGAAVTPGAVASPVIGEHGLSELVYFTLSGVGEGSSEAPIGDLPVGDAGLHPSLLIALRKADGSVAWTMRMDVYTYSSPVAVYTQDGRGWIVQCSSEGMIHLLDGLTGEAVSALRVQGRIEGSPAVYGDMMVLGTSGPWESRIYGVRLLSEP